MKTNYLKNYMNSIPTGKYKNIRDLIISECCISDGVWKNWLSGRTSIPVLAKPIINEIAGYDIFTEKEAAQVEN